MNARGADERGSRRIGKLRGSRRDRAESSTFTFYDICRVLRPFGLSRAEGGGEWKRDKKEAEDEEEEEEEEYESLKPNHPSVPTQIFLPRRFLPLHLSDMPLYIIRVIYMP